MSELSSNAQTPDEQPEMLTWKIGDVLNEAMDLLKGCKLPFWGALILYGVILGVLGYALEKILATLPGDIAAPVINQIIVGLVSYPMGAGLMMMGIKRAAGMPLRTTMIFDYYGKTLPIFLLNLLMIVLIAIGFLLLVLPGLYLAIAYAFAIPLLVEKNLGIWESLETSRKMVNKFWFRYFGLILAMVVILLISAIPLGIGLIWTLPMMFLVMGIVYRNTFVVEEEAAEEAPELAVS